jgi:hypothetical protein
MPETVSSLVLDLVQWAALRPRSRAEFIDAWRSSCPRLTIWEDAEELGLLERRPGGMIAVTAKGRACLRSRGRAPVAPGDPGLDRPSGPVDKGP